MATTTSTVVWLRPDEHGGLDAFIEAEHMGPPGEYETVKIEIDGVEVSLRGQRGLLLGVLDSALSNLLETTPWNGPIGGPVRLGEEVHETRNGEPL